MLLLPFLASLLSLNLVWAETHNHDHEDHEETHQDLEVLLELQGYDLVSSEECYLYIHEYGVDTDGSKETDFALVSTSYRHGEHQPEPMMVYRSEEDSSIFFGQGDHEDEWIEIELSAPMASIDDLRILSINWLHGSHSHTNRCVF